MAMLPVELLKKLGSGVRPDGAQSKRSVTGREPIDFSAMIAAARTGQIRSDRPASWDGAQNEQVLERSRSVIEEAMDRAEAAGVAKLLIAHAGAMLVADVAQRSIKEIETDGASILALHAEAVLVLAVEEDSVGELEQLEAIESGTKSAKRSIAAGIGWISNRSLGEVVAASERAGAAS